MTVIAKLEKSYVYEGSHKEFYIASSYNNNTHPIFKPILDPIILPQKPHNKSDWT